MDVITAFAYIDGNLYFGANHLDIMDNIYGEREWAVTNWENIHEGPEDGPKAFGWIFEEDGELTAEFYSDFYQNDYDSEAFEDIYQKLKKKYPALREITFGPDLETMKELNEWAEENHEAKVAFRWSKQGGLEIYKMGS